MNDSSITGYGFSPLRIGTCRICERVSLYNSFKIRAPVPRVGTVFGKAEEYKKGMQEETNRISLLVADEWSGI